MAVHHPAATIPISSSNSGAFTTSSSTSSTSTSLSTLTQVFSSESSPSSVSTKISIGTGQSEAGNTAHAHEGLSQGAKIGIAIPASIIAILLALLATWRWRKSKHLSTKKRMEPAPLLRRGLGQLDSQLAVKQRQASDAPSTYDMMEQSASLIVVAPSSEIDSTLRYLSNDHRRQYGYEQEKPTQNPCESQDTIDVDVDPDAVNDAHDEHHRLNQNDYSRTHTTTTVPPPFSQTQHMGMMRETEDIHSQPQPEVESRIRTLEDKLREVTERLGRMSEIGNDQENAPPPMYTSAL